MAVAGQVSRRRTSSLPHFDNHSFGKEQNRIWRRETARDGSVLDAVSIPRWRRVPSGRRRKHSGSADDSSRAGRFGHRHRTTGKGDGARVVLFPRLDRAGIGRRSMEQAKKDQPVSNPPPKPKAGSEIHHKEPGTKKEGRLLTCPRFVTCSVIARIFFALITA